MKPRRGTGTEASTRAPRATAAVLEDRRHNRSLVLQLVVDDGPLSRADLGSRHPPHAATTTSDSIAGLPRRGPGRRRRPARSAASASRRPRRDRPDARHILTLDVSADDHMHGAVVNLIGKVLHRRTVLARTSAPSWSPSLSRANWPAS